MNVGSWWKTVLVLFSLVAMPIVGQSQAVGNDQVDIPMQPLRVRSVKNGQRVVALPGLPIPKVDPGHDIRIPGRGRIDLPRMSQPRIDPGHDEPGVSEQEIIQMRAESERAIYQLCQHIVMRRHLQLSDDELNQMKKLVYTRRYTYSRKDLIQILGKDRARRAWQLYWQCKLGKTGQDLFSLFQNPMFTRDLEITETQQSQLQSLGRKIGVEAFHLKAKSEYRLDGRRMRIRLMVKPMTQKQHLAMCRGLAEIITPAQHRKLDALVGVELPGMPWSPTAAQKAADNGNLAGQPAGWAMPDRVSPAVPATK